MQTHKLVKCKTCKGIGSLVVKMRVSRNNIRHVVMPCFACEGKKYLPNKACARRAKVVAQKVSSKSKGSAKPARG